MARKDSKIKQNKGPIMGLARLLELLPESSSDFKGTELGQPAALAYMGRKADPEMCAYRLGSCRPLLLLKPAK